MYPLLLILKSAVRSPLSVRYGATEMTAIIIMIIITTVRGLECREGAVLPLAESVIRCFG